MSEIKKKQYIVLWSNNVGSCGETDYHIQHSVETLIEKVNNYLGKGYIPLGGMKSTINIDTDGGSKYQYNKYYQTMILKE